MSGLLVCVAPDGPGFVVCGTSPVSLDPELNELESADKNATATTK